MKEFKIIFPDDLGQAVEKAAQAEGKTVDEVITEAMKRDLGRRFLDKLKREGEARRGNMTDEEVERVVENGIAESRNETRNR